MVLEVINRKEEHHDTVQLQVYALNRGVIIFKITAHGVNAEIVEHHTCQQYQQPPGIRLCPIKSNHKAPYVDTNDSKDYVEERAALRLDFSDPGGFHNQPR